MKKYVFLGVIFLAIAGGLGYLAMRDVEEAPVVNTQQQSQPATTETESEPAAEQQTYRVVFDVTWSNETHPDSLPNDPHMSPAVLVRHSKAQSVFTPGTQASPGIEQMAETGATNILATELDEAGLAYVVGERVDTPGTYTFEITATQDSSLISLVSMIAPSPDWFVAVEDINLFENDQWVASRNVELQAYDAGTDSGKDFASNDADTNPKDLISSPTDEAFVSASQTAFGSVIITRIDN